MRVKCVSNLKQVGLSFRMWANDNNDKFPMQVSIANTNGSGTLELVGEGNVFPHFQAMSNELNDPKILICPEDSKRTAAPNFGTNFRDANVSYFVGVDADQVSPTNILTGDRNIAVGETLIGHGMSVLPNGSPVRWTSKIHNGKGYVGFADSSVQLCDSEKLREFFKNSGLATNRLVLP